MSSLFIESFATMQVNFNFTTWSFVVKQVRFIDFESFARIANQFLIKLCDYKLKKCSIKDRVEKATNVWTLNTIMNLLQQCEHCYLLKKVMLRKYFDLLLHELEHLSWILNMMHARDVHINQHDLTKDFIYARAFVRISSRF